MRIQKITRQLVSLVAQNALSLSVLFMFGLVVLLYACKKKDNPIDGNSINSEHIFEVYNVLSSTQDRFLAIADSLNGEAKLSLILTKEWMLSDPNVRTAEVLDSAYLRIVMKSGMFTTFVLKQIDDQGKSIFRGAGNIGSKSSDLKSFTRPSRSLGGIAGSKEITNRNVLFFAPAYTEFHYNTSGVLEALAKRFTDKDKSFNVTILKDANCTAGSISTFGNYGLVIMETHGLPDGFLIGTKVSFITKPKDEKELNDLIIQQNGNAVFDMLLNGDVGIIGQMRVNTSKPDWYKNPDKLSYELYATSKYLNSMPKWNKTVILGNMCYSGWTKMYRPELFSQPFIGTAFANRDLISYYGYAYDDGSATMVEDGFCKSMEDSLINNFINNEDSSGITHISKRTGLEFYDEYVYSQTKKFLRFKHFLSDNYSYRFCGYSFIDQRDGQVYKTVCIGEVPYRSIWMKQNLNYNVPGSYHYNNDPINGKTYGRLYTWYAIMDGAASSEKFPSGVRGICPLGWHVPSYQEWENVTYFLGGNTLAGGHLKAKNLWTSPNVGATDTVGFSALPGGYGHSDGTVFDYMGLQALFWYSADSKINVGTAKYKQIGNAQVSIYDGAINKELLLSCRCVKDF